MCVAASQSARHSESAPWYAVSVAADSETLRGVAPRSFAGLSTVRCCMTSSAGTDVLVRKARTQATTPRHVGCRMAVHPLITVPVLPAPPTAPPKTSSTPATPAPHPWTIEAAVSEARPIVRSVIIRGSIESGPIVGVTVSAISIAVPAASRCWCSAKCKEWRGGHEADK